MRFEAVLFDLDGTLVDTPAAWMEACLGTLAAHGVECDAERFLRDYYSQNRSLQSVLDDCGIGDRMTDFRRDRDDRYESLLRGRDLWLPDALEMLEWLSERAAMGIVTAAWRRYVDAMDARVHLDRLMDTIVTGEDYSHAPKPEAHGLLLAAERLGVEPEACAYVGDQPVDVLAARAAGMTSVLIRGSHTPTDAPEAHREAEGLGALHDWLAGG